MAKNEVKIPIIIDDKGTMKKTSVGAHSVDRRLKGAAQASSGASKNFSKMAQGITGGLVPAYATLAASLFALDAVYRALSGAADLRILKEGQLAFAKSTGQAMNVVAGAVQRATQFQVSFKEASQASAIAASAGFGTSQIVALGKAANDAAKVLGRSVPDAFDRLIRGVVKAEPEVLDELGIILRLDDAAERYAVQMGLTASELTVFEKQQAVLNDVLDQAERKFAAVAESIDPNPWTQLGVAMEKVKDDFAVWASSVLEPIATFLAGNTYAAIAAMGIFVAGIMKSLLPSYAAQAAKFKETQALQRGQIDLTIEKMNQLKLAKQGGTEALGMAEGRAMGLAQKADPAGKRTTLGKLQQGRVISAKQASKEIIRVRNLENQTIKGLTRKQTADYIRYLRTIETETKIGTKKIKGEFSRMGNFLQLTFQRIKMGWQFTMSAMTRLATLAGRAMSLAMSAMGWVGMIYMAVEAIKAWKKSQEEVDEAAERLKKRVDDLNKTYEDLIKTFEHVSKTVDDIRDGWTTSKEAVAFYSNTVKNIPIQDTIDLLKELDGKAVPEELRKNMNETFDLMKKIVPSLAEMNAEMDSTELLKYVMGFERFAAALQSVNIIYNTAQEAEVKYKKAQKSRMDTLIKSDYKKEIRELVTLVGAYAALEKVEEKVAPLMKEYNIEQNEAVELLAKREAALKTLLDIRIKELQAQRDQLDISRKQANLYKYQIKAKNTLTYDTERLVNALKRELQIEVAKEAAQGFGEYKKDKDTGEISTEFTAKKGMEWEFAEAQVQIARLEYEDAIQDIRLAYLKELENEWSRMQETIINSMASGMQKGLEGMMKGDMNLGEAISKMAETIGDAMAKQMSESWTEAIMDMLPPTAAQVAKEKAEEAAKTARKTMTEKMEALRDVTALAIKSAEEDIELPINLLREAILEQIKATKQNTAAQPMTQAGRMEQIKQANPKIFGEGGTGLQEGSKVKVAVGGDDGYITAGKYPEGENSTLYKIAANTNKAAEKAETAAKEAAKAAKIDLPTTITDNSQQNAFWVKIVDWAGVGAVSAAETTTVTEPLNLPQAQAADAAVITEAAADQAKREANAKETVTNLANDLAEKNIPGTGGGWPLPTNYQPPVVTPMISEEQKLKTAEAWAQSIIKSLEKEQIERNPYGTEVYKERLNMPFEKSDQLIEGLEKRIETLEKVFPGGVPPAITQNGEKGESSIGDVIDNVSDGDLLKVSEQEPEKVAGAMGGFIDSLLGGLGGGDSGGLGGLVMGFAQAAFAAKGGYVTKTGIQGFAGGGKVKGTTDTVPAMLTPGEYVLTPGQMRSMGQSSTVVNVNMGEGGGGATTSVRSDRAEAAEFGRAIASAVNHEIMKQKRAGGKLWMPGKGVI